MPKVKYIGEKKQHISSLPAGVMIVVEPGKVYELDAGFEYLRNHAMFKCLDEPKPLTDDEKHAIAARKKADEEEARRLAADAKKNQGK